MKYNPLQTFTSILLTSYYYDRALFEMLRAKSPDLLLASSTVGVFMKQQQKTEQISTACCKHKVLTLSKHFVL